MAKTSYLKMSWLVNDILINFIRLTRYNLASNYEIIAI